MISLKFTYSYSHLSNTQFYASVGNSGNSEMRGRTAEGLEVNEVLLQCGNGEMRGNGYAFFLSDPK
ncbi:MAG TPA: hypothetical protein VFO70_11040 [Chitinophagaceae bacterium]|nr:hypothetical protein [Chitinophagaceae bacterium]